MVQIQICGTNTFLKTLSLMKWKSPFTSAQNKENVFNCLKALVVKSLVSSDSAS